MIAIIFIAICFICLMFIVDIEFYKKMTIGMIGIGISFYIYSIFKGFNNYLPLDWNIWEIIVVFTYAIVPPGIILYILHYIKKHSSKYVDKKIGGNWHIHESFLGLILLLISIFLMIIRIILTQYEIFIYSFSFIIAIISLFLFFCLFFSSFLIFRDWHDFIQLKFLEKKIDDDDDNNNSLTFSTQVFSKLSSEDIHFFEVPKFKMYPMGILLASISLNILIYRNTLLPYQFFMISDESLLFFGYLLCFIAGGFLGKDWFRLFKKFYPDLYYEIETVLEKLKVMNNK
ncbi:MAG: hypothetical protein ACTSPD_04340 [Promethearchaeota archaeon]